ncbi:MAG: hypothetical protein AAF623_01345, partial [Planctomycetota bacterium]
ISRRALAAVGSGLNPFQRQRCEQLLKRKVHVLRSAVNRCFPLGKRDVLVGQHRTPLKNTNL